MYAQQPLAIVGHGGDHSLEFPGDIARTLRTVERIVGAIEEMIV